MASGSAVLQFIAERDHRLMRRVNRWRAPIWIRLWMVCATRGGDGWMWYSICLALLFLGGAERFRAVFEAALASGTGVMMFLWMKKKAGRVRPCALEPHCWATLLPPDQFSFPSGHTISAFAFAVPLSEHYPALGVGLLFCAVSVAVYRILLGMHFLSDVAAGAVLGSGLGYLAFCLLH